MKEFVLKVKSPLVSMAVWKSVYLCTAVLLSVLMTSCNDGEVNDRKDIIVNNDASELSSRVVMYNAPSVQHIDKMPEIPTLPQNYIILDETYNGKNAKKEDYYLPEGSKLTADIRFNDNVYYIGGELILTDKYSGSGKLVVLPQGKVICQLDKCVGKIEILNYGDFELESNTFTIDKDAAFMTNKAFAIRELYVNGSFYTSTELSVSTATVKKSGVCLVGCGMYVEKSLTLHNAGTVAVGSYLSAQSVIIGSLATLSINAGGLVETKTLAVKSPCTITSCGDEMDYAVISAGKIELDRKDVRKIFTGWLDVHCDNIVTSSGKDIEWLSSIRLNGDTYLPEEGCHPAFGEKPEVVEPKIVIEHVAEVISPDHLHNISATCIQAVGDRAYVSYHTRGSKYHGCVEVLDIDIDTCSIVSYMEHPYLDFNHLIVDGNSIVVAGDDPGKGAFLGMIDLQNGIFPIDNPLFSQLPVDGASANCVFRNGSAYLVATNRGYHSVDVASLELAASVATPGSSKFIHSTGSKIGVLYLVDKDSESSKAKLSVYSSVDYNFTSPLQTMELDMIAPVNGKNVFQFDGDDIYVCLGRNGVKRYGNGNVIAEFDVKDDAMAAANGLAVDDKYVYVASGIGGLFVLDKSDLSVVASYRHSGGKSANYVTVAGNIIYVAYGLSGVQIFKLMEK